MPGSPVIPKREPEGDTTLDEFERLYKGGDRLELAQRFATEVGIISESGGSTEGLPSRELGNRINKWFDFVKTTLVEQQLVNQLQTTFEEFEIRGPGLKFWALCYMAMGYWLPNEQALQKLFLADYEDGEDELGAVQRTLRSGITEVKENFNSVKERLASGEPVDLSEEIKKARFLAETISLIKTVVSEGDSLADELD